MEKSIIIDTPLGIRMAQLSAQIGAIRLEMAGIKRRGRSVYSLVKDQYALKGTRAKVLEQLIELLENLAPTTIIDGVGFRAGELTVNGVPVGRADQDLKHGYHPAVHVTVGAHGTWFEQDEPNLTQLIADYVHQFYPKEEAVPESKPDVNCDICKAKHLPEYIDGKTKMGPWGNMCPKCWARFGVNRLGTGFGQHYKWQGSKYTKIAG